MAEEFPVLQTGTTGAEEEARSAIGTVLAQLFTIIRNILNYVLEYARKFFQWAGENPLYATLFVSNLIIWLS